MSVKELVNIDVALKENDGYQAQNLSDANWSGKTIEPVLVNGYDGFSGTHDNLLWTPSTGMITYTLHNKVIIENTRTRQQTIIAESEVRLSTLARSPNERILAAAEGEPSRDGNAMIFLIDTQ